MFTIDNTLGAFLIGSWVNTMLYMVEVGQVVHYFFTRRNDRLAFKCAVGAAILLDTVCTLATYALAYLSLITNIGMIPTSTPWPVPITVFTNSTAGTIMQVFLVSRFYNLSKQVIITATISIAIIASYAGSMATVVYTSTSHSALPSKNENITISITLASNAATDIAAAAALIWKLRSMGLPSQIKSTQQTIRRITVMALQTGVIPCTVVLVMLILRYTEKGSQIGYAISSILGRVYSITLLYNLNGRPMKQDIPSVVTSGGLTDSFNLATLRTRPSVFLHSDQHKSKSSVSAEPDRPPDINIVEVNLPGHAHDT